MLTTIAIAIVTTCMASCERESIQIVGYVDLGLPSGTQWKEKNEVNPADSVYNLYTYDEAMTEFGEQLPTKEQFEELKSSVNPVRLKNHPIAIDDDTIDILYHNILNGDLK